MRQLVVSAVGLLNWRTPDPTVYESMKYCCQARVGTSNAAVLRKAATAEDASLQLHGPGKTFSRSSHIRINSHHASAAGHWHGCKCYLEPGVALHSSQIFIGSSHLTGPYHPSGTHIKFDGVLAEALVKWLRNRLHIFLFGHILPSWLCSDEASGLHRMSDLGRQ